MGHGTFSVLVVHRHFFTVIRMPADGLVDGAFLLIQLSETDGTVSSVDGMFLQLFCNAMKAWNYLMLLGYGARDVIITGDSAGGNLALSLVLKLKEQERLFPRGIVLMSPWTDLTGEGKTFQTKAELDPVLDKEYIDRMTRAYAPDRDLTDPYISPLFGNFHGFPPVYIQVGENEILLDDSLRLYKNLIKAGVAAHIDRFPGMWHVFQMSPFKKASEAMDKNAEFIYSVCR